MSAAFDVVNVDLLLKRLSKMGMPKDFTEILAGWLKDRVAYVELKGHCLDFEWSTFL